MKARIELLLALSGLMQPFREERPMNIDKMRMDFEVWECVTDEGPQTDPAWLMFDEKTNTFLLDKIQERWRVWQASRAAVEVEIPGYDALLRKLYDGLDINAVTEAIHAQGLRVRMIP